MSNLSILKPDKENLNTFILLGSFFIILSFIDILGNTFLEINLTSFLPSSISYFSPLIIGLFLMLILQDLQNKIVLVEELVGFLLKYGLKDSCMECIQMQNNGE